MVMARGQRSGSGFTRKSRRGNAPLTVGAAVAAFGLVLAVLFMAFDSDENPNPQPVTKPVVDPVNSQAASIKPVLKTPVSPSRQVILDAEPNAVVVNLDEVFGPEEAQ